MWSFHKLLRKKIISWGINTANTLRICAIVCNAAWFSNFQWLHVFIIWLKCLLKLPFTRPVKTSDFCCNFTRNFFLLDVMIFFLSYKYSKVYAISQQPSHSSQIATKIAQQKLFDVLIVSVHRWMHFKNMKNRPALPNRIGSVLTSSSCVYVI